MVSPLATIHPDGAKSFGGPPIAELAIPTVVAGAAASGGDGAANGE